MYKFLKSFSCYLAVMLILASCLFFPSFSASASSLELMNYSTVSYDEVEFTDGSFSHSTSAIVSLCFAESDSVNPTLPQLPTGRYVVLAPEYNWANIESASPPAQVVLFNSDGTSYLSFGQEFFLDGANADFFYVQSPNSDAPPSVYRVLDDPPLYQSAWDMFVKFIYGENAQLTPDQNLTLTLLASIAVLAVVLIPFAVVYFVLRFIFGWR